MRPTIGTRSVFIVAGILLGLSSVAVAISSAGAASGVEGHVSIVASQTPAFPGDAPDPDVVYSNGTYYAFTTGTPLGNRIQALVDTSGNPATGWGSYTGVNHGSTALPTAPAWETPNTQTSPGVFSYGGHWVMFYDAVRQSPCRRQRLQLPFGGDGAFIDSERPGFHRLVGRASVLRARRGVGPQPVRRPCHRRGVPALEVQRRQLIAAIPGLVRPAQR